MISSALSVAVSALRAHSYAAETTSHNVANAATPGYRRQRVELEAAFPRSGPLGQMGAGVEAARITRATDRLTDARVRSSAAQAEYFGTRAGLIRIVEGTFGEPSKGVTNELAGVWDAFATLAVTPSDGAARNQVIARLNSAADRINQIGSALDVLNKDATTRLAGDISAANAIITRLVEFNRLPRSPEGLQGDLADQRDHAIDTLAATLGAAATIDDDGQVRVTLNGLALVDRDRGVALSLAPGPAVGVVTHPSGSVTLSGSAGGLQAALTTDIVDARNELDTFTNGFLAALNAGHAAGFTPAGAPGGPLLAIVGGRLTVAVTQPADLAATDVAGQSQNGQAADALAQLRETQGTAYRSLVTSLAGRVAGLERSADTAQTIADDASLQRDSEVGVNLDEEMTDLMSQQRAYQAAARLVTVIDDMLQTLIQM
ncbi:MAG: flagellar hook-associated protein FlgK [Actinobacteria bacterium]|nr:flagellar hook-associated protein FlgK [Actinomycetota bacterium]